MLSDPKIDYTAESVNHPIKDDHVEDGDALSPGGPVIDGETNRKLLRKIDICLMPVVGTTFQPIYHISNLPMIDVLHICTPILRQGSPQSSGYLRIEGGSWS